MKTTAYTLPRQKALVTACLNAIGAIKEIQRIEDCQIMQHSLTNLVSELQWCSNAYMPGGIVKKPKNKEAT